MTTNPLVVNERAKRIRALSVNIPGSYQQLAELTSIEEKAGTPTAD